MRAFLVLRAISGVSYLEIEAVSSVFENSVVAK